MAGYMKDAHRHAEKIKYYHENAGSKGYDQAIYHFDKLTGLIFKAMQSNRYKGEAPLINSIKKGASGNSVGGPNILCYRVL